MSSSLLDVSNDAREEFSLKDIEMFGDNEEQNWFKRVHVGKFLGPEDIRTPLNDLEKCEMLTINAFDPTQSIALGWHGPKDQKNKTYKFFSVFGVITPKKCPKEMILR